MTDHIEPILIAASACIFAVVLLAVLRWLIRPKKYKTGLSRLDILTSGGMRGGESRCHVETNPDGTCTLSFLKKADYWSVSKVEEYRCDSSLISALEKLFYKYGMRSWGNIRKVRELDRDRECRQYRFTFGTETTSFSDQLRLPENRRDAEKELNRILEQAKQNGTLLPSLQIGDLEKDEELYTTYNDVTFEDVRMEAVGWYNRTLIVRIFNGLNSNAFFRTDMKLFKDGEETPIYESTESTSEETVKPTNIRDFEYRLPLTLEPGTYRLHLGDHLRCKFIIQ